MSDLHSLDAIREAAENPQTSTTVITPAAVLALVELAEAARQSAAMLEGETPTVLDIALARFSFVEGDEAA